jgi:transposase
MKHDLSPRAQVVALKQGGHSQRQAASINGKPLSSIERWWKTVQIDTLDYQHAQQEDKDFHQATFTGHG